MMEKSATDVKSERMSLLADFYGSLLPERQAEVFRRYYEENFSLTEIAEEFAVSKQAISGMLKKARSTLENYEKELRLITKHRQYDEILDSIEDRISSEKGRGDTASKLAVKELTEVKRLVARLEL
ncbi:MAG: hypothetical protein LBK04_04400 [Clostridiales Family XIII bacterium]|jgi:predicted DNA-binding protein YlxM (UPF0122 family)|nr:hypothetical protein [Clostridiales Family XIII bacterium]